jgi:DNA mismatch endonuclease (patch repair protein)
MSRVKSCNTGPERIVRSLLHGLGFRFRLHRKDLPGKPDIVLPKHRKAVFVHGCFWHGHEGCPRAVRPSNNREFWDIKLSRNIERDRQSLEELGKQGWSTLVVWQCELKNPEELSKKLRAFMRNRIQIHDGAKI